jgi:hypothetical protein
MITNYEVPHCATSSILPPPHPSTFPYFIKKDRLMVLYPFVTTPKNFLSLLMDFMKIVTDMQRKW